MRIFLILFTFYLLSNGQSFAKTTTAINDGNWTTGGTWDNGVPVEGDYIIIQSNVTIIGIVNLAGAGITTIEIQSGGDLEIYGLLNINASDGDSIVIATGATISRGIITADWGDWIVVDPADPITGPATIEDGVLPIELISFNANLTGDVVDVSWATAAEINNDLLLSDLIMELIGK